MSSRRKKSHIRSNLSDRSASPVSEIGSDVISDVGDSVSQTNNNPSYSTRRKPDSPIVKFVNRRTEPDDKLSHVSFYTNKSGMTELEERLTNKVQELEEALLRERDKIDAIDGKTSQYSSDLARSRQILTEAEKKSAMLQNAINSERKRGDSYKSELTEMQKMYQQVSQEMKQKTEELSRALVDIEKAKEESATEIDKLTQKIVTLTEDRGKGNTRNIMSDYHDLQTKIELNETIRELNYLKEQNRELMRYIDYVGDNNGMTVYNSLEWIFGFLTMRFLDDKKYGFFQISD